MIIETITKKDYTIVRIGFEDDIRIDMQEKIKELYMLNSPIKDFSLYYPFPLDAYELEEWDTILDWEKVSLNKQIKWSVELIKKFSDRWNWGLLWLNQSVLCWDAELLDICKDKIHWELIVCNSINWTRELQEKFKEYLPPSSSFIDYDMIKEHTTNNRNRFLNNPYPHISDTFKKLYLYASSIDEDKGIYILYDSISIYFNTKL
ncbi:hypothetical protein IR083_09750 [Dysgonomonas sp. GY75]|uniref:hypothetical protein n=1 Tax=Dysgonomonas sp. GY75 TaxID=2780419 RepID=UPI0018837521|nr:hypothetical protein [Dysgonomonas sp. GY75]MBF0649103.1 hypothetical protein [Dysgonomonas sp. GY75]